MRKLKWALPFLAVFFPIALLSFYTYSVASRSVRDLVDSENVAATGNLSQLLTQHTKQTATLLQAFAAVPGTQKAVAEKDEFTITTRLKALTVSYPQIERAYITDAKGNALGVYPQSSLVMRTASGTYGQDLSRTDWYKNVMQTRKSYISGVFQSIDNGSSAIAFATPVIYLETGEILGVVVFEYPTEQIKQWLNNIDLSHGGNIFIVDHTATLVAHPDTQKKQKPQYSDVISRTNGKHFAGYRHLEVMEKALAGSLHVSEYTDPLSGKEMIAAFLPLAIGSNIWVVVAQQPTELAYKELRRVSLNISLVGGVLTLFTLFMSFALAKMSRRNIKLNEDLEERNLLLKDLTSFVSHQLKAPVTAVSWILENIFDGDYGDVPKQLNEPLGELQDVNKSNYRLITNILNVSRIDRGVIDVECKKILLGDVAERTVRDYLEAAKKVGLYLKIEGNNHTEIFVDLEKTAEAITNAISNAIKYTKSGGITLRLSKDEKFGIISVEDTGEGMPPEMLEKLFSRDQVHGANTAAANSSGLGLYIAKNFIEMQGGEVLVESELGKGSTFIYKLPLYTGQNTEDEEG